MEAKGVNVDFFPISHRDFFFFCCALGISYFINIHSQKEEK